MDMSILTNRFKSENDAFKENKKLAIEL